MSTLAVGIRGDLSTRVVHIIALRSFAMAMELGSLSAAARRLGYTRAGVCRHIRLLEGELGAKLFLRAGRSVVPTEVAQQIRGPVEDILERLSDLVAVAQEVQIPPADRRSAGHVGDAIVGRTR